MIRPWKFLRHHKDNDYNILRIREQWVEDPRTGHEHPRTIIECADWVQIIPLTKSGQVVMVRQFRIAAQTPSLEWPGGMVDRGEDPARAGARELEEETGYRAGPVTSLGAPHPNPALQTNRCHVFLAMDCEPIHAGRPEEGEDLETVVLNVDDLRARVLSGDITHALTLAALYLWKG